MVSEKTNRAVFGKNGFPVLCRAIRIVWLFTRITVFLSLTFCERQEPSDGSFDCSKCYQDEPAMGPLTIYITINSENQRVPLVIYRGDIESNVIEYVDTSFQSEYWVDVPVDEYYSVKAEYKDGEKTIYAVDGDKLKLKKNATSCDQECFYFDGGYLDVRLRN
jgi:hypothetical protein